MNLPNYLTSFRIVLIPVFIIAFYLPFNWSYLASAAIFFVAGGTDFLDGYLARKLNQSTPFGAFLDPVADKLMVVICMVLLAERFAVWYFTLPALVIVGREIIISSLREWMAELGKRASVAVSFIGKIKTMAQMGAILLFLLVNADEGGRIQVLAYIALYISAILTFWSMVLYLKAAWPELNPNRSKNLESSQ